MQKMKINENFYTFLMENFIILQVKTNERVELDKRLDQILGFENFGNCSSPNIADHHLIATVKIVKTGVEIPLTYAATKDAANCAHIKRFVKEVVTLLQEYGFVVIATLCDQGNY